MTRDFGIKISKEGYDVKTALPKDLIFSSEFPCIKFLKVGKQDYTIAGGGNQEFTIAHESNLPVLPFAFDLRSSKYKAVEPENITLDDTNVYFKIVNSTGSPITSYFYYFIGIS